MEYLQFVTLARGSKGDDQQAESAPREGEYAEG